MSAGNEPDVDRQLEELQEQAGELIPQCRFASSNRLYSELRRRGKTEQRAYFYLMGTFYQMDQAQYLLEFQRMRERAVELIALLEDPERVRQIQADFPTDQYEQLVYSMSSCAYENLAEATGQLEGYNSEGMHACISDGLQICRRTGKLSCISCFREYACDVYLAADDADIAMHQCRLVTDQEGAWSDRGDRRWVASAKAGWLDALNGRFESAIELLQKALEYCSAEAVSLKTESRLRTLLQLDAVLIAAGHDPVMESDPAWELMPTADECPLFEHQRDLNAALLATRREDWEEANQRLVKWDQRLQKCGGTHLWFETRLRLIAMKRLSGQQKQAEALAKQLEQRARPANDWLTLRRLDSLMTSTTPSIIAATPDVRSTPSLPPHQSQETGTTVSTASTNVADPAQADAVLADSAQHVGQGDAGHSDPIESPATPLAATIAALRDRMQDLMRDPSDEKFHSLRQDILATDPTSVTHFDDVAALIHMMLWLTGGAEDGEEIWRWANAMAAAHRDKGLVLSVLGALGDALRDSPNEALTDKITAERTEQLLRKGLELDGDRARNHMRAGDHYLRDNNPGEAERCFARAFRLDRTLPDVVERLADLYGETDRPRDALHVLDLSLREGCTEPRIAFNAAMIAFRLRQYDSTQTYLDRFESLGGQNPAWVCYYRAVCCYELADYRRSLELTDQAQQAAESVGWHLEAIRGAAKAQLGQVEEALGHIEFVLSTPLREVNFLSPTGLAALLERLLSVSKDVLHDDAIRMRLERRLLRSGLMPDWWFQAQRSGGEPVEGVFLFRCAMIQPLDESWIDDPDRLDHEGTWSAYGVEWGILATSEEEAGALAEQWQTKIYHLPCELQEAVSGRETYTDIPGAVWLSSRFPVSDDDDDDDLFGDGDFGEGGSGEGGDSDDDFEQRNGFDDPPCPF